MAETTQPHRRQSLRRSDAMAALTEDILLRIFRRLTLRQDRAAAALVCKRWLELVSAPVTACHVLAPEGLVGLVHRCPNLTSIDCSGTIHMEDEHVIALAERYAGALTSLSLTRNKKVTEKGLRALGQHCRGLKELNLTAGTFEDSGLMRISPCTKLESLQLTNCRAITEVGVSCIAARCKSLRDLSLRWCMGVTDEAVEVLVLNCPQLQSLDLAYTKVSTDAMQALSQAPNLRALNVSACAAMNDAALGALASGRCPLQTLEITGCGQISDDGIASLASGGFNLQELMASMCPQMTNDVFRHLSRFPSLSVLKLDHNAISSAGLALLGVRHGNHTPATSLRGLSVARCYDLSSDSLGVVLSNGIHLQRLNLTCCKNITDPVLTTLAQHCSDLRLLHIEGCQGLTEGAFEVLVSGCPKLEDLDCTDCGLTETGLLAISSLKNLTSLKLGFCPHTTDAVLESIGAHCKKLRDLDLYRCSGFGARGLASLSRGCPELLNLNLSYCKDDVTDRGLAAFSHGCGARHLKNMEMRGCRLVTGMGLAALATGCGGLQELDLKKCSGINDVGLIAISQGCQYLRQVNLSYCPVSDEGLMALATMSCMVKFNLVHCHRLSVPGLCRAFLRCNGLRKVKLLLSLKDKFPFEDLAALEERGCVFRWMEKPADAFQE